MLMSDNYPGLQGPEMAARMQFDKMQADTGIARHWLTSPQRARLKPGTILTWRKNTVFVLGHRVPWILLIRQS